MLATINLEKELAEIRKLSSDEVFLTSIKAALSVEAVNEESIRSALSKGKDIEESLDIDSPAIINRSKIYDLEQIKILCQRYHLRFLSTSYFKQEYPYEAIKAIKHFEKEHGIKVSSFSIIAPAKAFELENYYRDPLLFADLGNGKYYLLHKWGNDLHPLRRIVYWPLQSFLHMLIFVLFVSVVISFSIPHEALFAPQLEHDALSVFYLRVMFSFFTGIVLCGILAYSYFAYNLIPSSQNWRSRYFNN